MDIVPIYVNRYSLPLWDVLNYEFMRPYAANAMSGKELYTYNHMMNSVYNFVPFESVRVETDSNI